MKHVVPKLCVIGLAVLVALPLTAQDAGKKKRKKGDGQSQQVRALLKSLETVELNEEQKGKVKEIVAKYEPKLKQARETLGAEGLQAANKARKDAKDGGKKGRELQQAVLGSLSEEQKKAWRAMQQVNQDMRAEVGKLLTDEQREKAGLTQNVGKGKKKKNKNK